MYHIHLTLAVEPSHAVRAAMYLATQSPSFTVHNKRGGSLEVCWSVADNSPATVLQDAVELLAEAPGKPQVLAVTITRL